MQNVQKCVRLQVNSPLSDPLMGKVGLIVKNPDFNFNKDNVLKVSKVFLSLAILRQQRI